MPSTDDLETRLAFLAAAVDASEDAVLCLDRDSRLTRWNAQAQRLFGDPDYLLRVVARDLTAFRQLYDERLATLPGVQRLSSTLVMASIVEARPLPL